MTALEEEVSLKHYSDTDYIVLRIEIHEPRDLHRAILAELLKEYLEKTA
jgi:hypothetical protein